MQIDIYPTYSIVISVQVEALVIIVINCLMGVITSLSWVET